MPRDRKLAIRWAGLPLPPNVEGNFAVVGTKGSGKTLILNTLMRSVLCHLDKDNPDAPGARALVFDSKTELYPLVRKFAPSAKVWLLNPFDNRSHAWHVARDIDSTIAAQELAAVFMPENQNESQPFFRDMAAQAVTAVFEALHHVAGERWTLWHAYQILTDPTRFKHLVSHHHSTAAILPTLEKTEQTFLNVLATVISKLAQLKVVAALWDCIPPERRFSLKDWVASRNNVLMLAKPKMLSETVTALNRVLFKRLTQLLLSPSTTTKALRERGRTWFFLDEFRNLGRLDGVNDVLTEGRSFGLRTAIGFQDIGGLRYAMGDEKLADEAINLCDFLSVLRCQGETAEWASKQLGDREIVERQVSMSEGRMGYSSSRSPSPAVMPPEIRDLPTVEAIQGIAGFHVWPSQGGGNIAYATGTKFDSIRNIREHSPAIKIDFTVSPRDLAENEKFQEWPNPLMQIPRPWTDDEWTKLGLPRPEAAKSSAKPKKRKLPTVDDLRGN